MTEKLLGRADADLGEGLFDSVAWVIDLIGLEKNLLQGRWRSAVLHCVNEDSPLKVGFYLQASPNVTDLPDYTWLPYKTCQACDHKGWILADNSDHGLRLERCDSCNRFSTDAEAVTYAAAIAAGKSETDAVIEVSRLGRKPPVVDIDVLVKLSISVSMTYDLAFPKARQLKFDALQNFLDHPALKDINTLETFVDSMVTSRGDDLTKEY